MTGMTQRCYVLVASCSAYSDAWLPFIRLYQQYGYASWPVVLATHQCELGVHDEETILGLGYGRLLATDRDHGWCQNLLRALDALEDPNAYVLLLLEDLFPSAPFQGEFLDRACDLLDARSLVGAVRLYPSDDPLQSADDDYHEYGILPKGVPYRVCCLPSVFRQDFLRRCLEATLQHGGSTAWDFEHYATRAAERYPQVIRSWYRNRHPWPLSVLYTAITRGKWEASAVQFCLDHGIAVDTSRGVRGQAAEAFVPPFTPDDVRNLTCIQTGRLSMGEQVRRFEEGLAHYLGCRYVVMVNSGSSANLLAVSALRALRPDVRSITVPAVTWPTTLWPCVQLGLEVQIADVDPQTLCLRDPEYATDAVFAVHLLGRVCSATARGGIVLEDTCEALGGEDGARRKLGTAGWMGTYSFYYAHHIVAIEGGAIATDDREVYLELVAQRAHGWARDLPVADRRRWEQAHPELDPAFLFVTSGYNVRPIEIQAELAARQLHGFPGMLRRRTTIASRLTEAAQGSAIVPYDIGPGVHAWFAYPIVARDPQGRQRLVRLLNEHGVDWRPLVAGNLLRQPALQRHRLQAEPTPGADQIHDCGLYLPIHPLRPDAYWQRAVDALGLYARTPEPELVGA